MIRLIVACDRKRGMAKKGFQPWYIPEDEAYFTEETKKYGGNVLVGSTTFKTFHGPLAGRQNYVLTRDETPINGVELVHDLGGFLESLEGRDLWVIGGARVFAQVMEAGEADELYVTRIEADFGCNQFFPDYEANFQLVERGDLKEQNGFIFSFARYAKKAATRQSNA
ncbi:MAG: dihydrofolate reductase [Candidatus Saccharimonadales bacterium]